MAIKAAHFLEQACGIMLLSPFLRIRGPAINLSLLKFAIALSLTYIRTSLLSGGPWTQTSDIGFI